ncbi:Spectrin beta chain, non-erythrocytic 5 [Saguinus oedipus]|uniref:Spectrin beta chain, non-erythrocytic 5 n=1 Tax=Saguinus oedipus TaxID=9490 RepID=A0ABQ9V312_SAGOE|nr:Spectrin beta chain, non-erythrocytic 5 [Saguinus oedipus]
MPKVPMGPAQHRLQLEARAGWKESPLGSSVEEVEQLIRKHNVFLKVLTAQDKKEAALREQLKALRGPRGQDPLPAVLQRRARVKELAESRGHALCASLLMAGFIQAATQVRGHPQPRAFQGDHT